MYPFIFHTTRDICTLINVIGFCSSTHQLKENEEKKKEKEKKKRREKKKKKEKKMIEKRF